MSLSYHLMSNEILQIYNTFHYIFTANFVVHWYHQIKFHLSLNVFFFFWCDYFSIIVKVKLRRNFQLTSSLQVGDIEGDSPQVKRLRMSSSDALQDMISGEELSLYASAPNNADSAQVVYHSVNSEGLFSVLFCLVITFGEFLCKDKEGVPW